MDEEDSFFSYICSNFVNHRSLNTPATFHPLSWPRGGSSPSNNSKTRSIISDTHHDRTIFRAGDGRPKIFAPLNRPLSGPRADRLFCQVLLPAPLPIFGNATLQVEPIRLEKPAAHFRADNAVIDKLCGRTPRWGRIDNRGGGDPPPCHRDPPRFVVILQLLFRNNFLYI